MNLGTLLIYFTWLIILYSLFPFVFVMSKVVKFIRKAEIKLRSILFWNGAIVFIQEAYLELCITCWLNLTIINDWSNRDMMITNSITIILSTGCVVLPIFTLLWIWPNYKKLKNEE